MYRPLRTIGIIAGGVALSVWAGCARIGQQASAPGALPRPAPLDKTVQLNATTLFAHGHLLERQGMHERAAAQYQKALQLNPSFLTARNRLGITLNKLGRHSEASEQFRVAIAQSPDQAHVHNNLGFSLYLEGQLGEAEGALDEALELNPSFSRARLNRGIVLAKLGRFDEALTELLLVGARTDAYFNMGILLTDAERFTDAAEYLEAALDLDPEFDAARRQLREVSRLAAEYQARQAARLAAAEHAQRLAELASDASPAGADPDVPAGPAERADERSDTNPAADTLSPIADVARALPPADSIDRQHVARAEDTPVSDGAADATMGAGAEDVLEALESIVLAERMADLGTVDSTWCRLEHLLFPEEAPDPVAPPASAEERDLDDFQREIDLLWLPESLRELFR